MWQKPLGEWAERNVYKKEMGLVDSARGNTVHLMNAESLHPKNPRQQCTFTIAPSPPAPAMQINYTEIIALRQRMKS